VTSIVLIATRATRYDRVTVELSLLTS